MLVILCSIIPTAIVPKINPCFHILNICVPLQRIRNSFVHEQYSVVKDSYSTSINTALCNAKYVRISISVRSEAKLKLILKLSTLYETNPLCAT